MSKKYRASQGKPVNIYALIDPDTDEVRYIGKTAQVLKTRLSHHLCDREANHRTHWIQALMRAGKKPTIELLEIATSENWEARESYWIAEMRRRFGKRLTNAADGGKGGVGHTVSKEAREKIAAAHRGKKRPHEGRRVASFILTTPAGEEIPVTNLCKFARENDLVACSFYQVLSGKTRDYCGWLIRRDGEPPPVLKARSNPARRRGSFPTRTMTGGSDWRSRPKKPAEELTPSGLRARQRREKDVPIFVTGDWEPAAAPVVVKK